MQLCASSVLRDSNLDIDTGLDGHGGLQIADGSATGGEQRLRTTHNLLDDLRGGGKVDETLVDSHLVSVPGLGTLTAWLSGRGTTESAKAPQQCNDNATHSLSGGVNENLGRETDGSLHSEVLVLCPVDEVVADLLEGLDLRAGQGDSDLVALGAVASLDALLVFLCDVTHFSCVETLSQR